MKVANTWLILNVGGGPTDDKPTVTLTTPPDPSRTSGFLNVPVVDIHKVYKEWAAKGAEFLTGAEDGGACFGFDDWTVRSSGSRSTAPGCRLAPGALRGARRLKADHNSQKLTLPGYCSTRVSVDICGPASDSPASAPGL
jgi:hypothetical protein